MAAVHTPLDFAGIIGLFGRIGDFCRVTGIPDATVRAWVRRDLIPAEHWDDVIAAAVRFKIPGVSVDSLMAAMRIGKARRDEKRARRRAAEAGIRAHESAR